MKPALTFMSNMFFGPDGPAWSSHMNRIRRVFPHPVSPMMMTGIPHLMKDSITQFNEKLSDLFFKDTYQKACVFSMGRSQGSL